MKTMRDIQLPRQIPQYLQRLCVQGGILAQLLEEMKRWQQTFVDSLHYIVATTVQCKKTHASQKL